MKNRLSAYPLTRVFTLVAMVGFQMATPITNVLADRATVVDNAIWVHDALYGTVVTDWHSNTSRLSKELFYPGYDLVLPQILQFHSRYLFGQTINSHDQSTCHGSL